jgi:hypothetical protein
MTAAEERSDDEDDNSLEGAIARSLFPMESESNDDEADNQIEHDESHDDASTSFSVDVFARHGRCHSRATSGIVDSRTALARGAVPCSVRHGLSGRLLGSIAAQSPQR